MKRVSVIAGLAAFATGGCVSKHSVDRGLRVGIFSLAGTIDPYSAAGDSDQYAWIYGDGLTTGERVPRAMLAEPPAAVDAGRTLRYQLRRFRWHDGSPLHAAHVIDALETLRRAQSPWLTYEPYTLVKDISTRGSGIVEVRLHHASETFARSFFSPYGRPALPLLRHVFGRTLGTGPFRRRDGRGDRMTFDAWNGSPRGVPRSNALDILNVPSARTIALQLADGELDAALPIARGVLPLRLESRYRIVTRPGSVVVMLVNCAGAFASRERRHALLQALDARALRHALHSVGTTEAHTLLPEGTPGDVAFAFPRRDVARAARVLRDVRTPVRICFIGGNVRYERLALFLHGMLREIGIGAALEPFPVPSYLAAVGPLRTGRFDIAFYGLDYSERPDLLPDWSCRNVPPHGVNFARYCDPFFDKEAMQGALRAALGTLLRDGAVVPLARLQETFGVGPMMRGFALPRHFVPFTVGAQSWYRVAG